MERLSLENEGPKPTRDAIGRWIFSHVPRTGGTTLTETLRAIFGRAFLFISEYTGGLPDDGSPAVHAAGGHAFFGIDRIMGGDWRYATLLRDPLDRVLSQYNVLTSLGTLPTKDPADRYTENHLLESQAVLANWQVRFLTGKAYTPPFWDPAKLFEPMPTLGEEDVEDAIGHLGDRFFFAGIQEAYDESLLMLSEAADLPLPVYVRHNVTDGLTTAGRECLRRRDLSVDALARLAEANRLDHAVYRHCERELRLRLSATRPEFALAVDHFRAINERLRSVAAEVGSRAFHFIEGMTANDVSSLLRGQTSACDRLRVGLAREPLPVTARLETPEQILGNVTHVVTFTGLSPEPSVQEANPVDPEVRRGAPLQL